MKKIELPAEGLVQHGASAPRRRMYGRCCDQDQRRGEITISLFCYHSISLRTLTCSQDSEYPRKAERCVNTFQGGTIPFHLVCSVRGEEMSQDDDVGFLYKTMSELLQYCMRIIPVIMFHRCGT